jgi:parvulin-like peptidyl-prolyl isomerase
MRLIAVAAPLAALVLLAPVPVHADDADAATTPPKASAPAAKPAAAPAPKPAAAAAAVTTPAAEPERITIQHVLIGFAGSVPGKQITRTQEEAKAMAEDILARARKGEDFDALVKQHTDDSHPGIYTLANVGVTPGQGEWARTRMVPAFGDAGFPLKVGEVGMAAYDKARSPFGWHVVKRIK